MKFTKQHYLLMISIAFMLNAVHAFAATDGKYFKGKYGDLYYQTKGDGIPAVIINGGPGAGHTVFLKWFDFISDLGMKVVYFDETGRGRATREVKGQKISPQMGVDDLESLRIELKAEKIVVIAHSYGGIQGLQYALQYPHRVKKLIMLNTSYDAESHMMNINHVKHYTKTRYPERWEKVMALREQGVKSSDERYHELLSVGAEMFWFKPENRKNLRQVRTGDKRDYFNFQVYLDIIGEDPEWLIDGTLAGLSVKHKLKHFNIPSLIIGGRHDKITTPEMVYSLVNLLPIETTYYEMFEQSGHWPWVEETEKFNDLLSEFLTKKTP